MLNRPLAAHASAKNDRLNGKKETLLRSQIRNGAQHSERETEQRAQKSRQRGRKKGNSASAKR